MSVHKSTKKGSNIICRVSNVTPERVCSYVKRMPKQKMKEDAFRDIMGKSWFQNEHQAPEQWGLYYIDGTDYYPRFDHDITIEEAEAYLYHWMRNLIVINPYTRFKKQCNKNLVESIVGQLENNPNEHDLKTIIGKIIDSDEPFVINEIIANVLNNYSRVLKVETINKDNEQFNVSLIPNYKEILKAQYNMTKKEYFELFDSVKTAFDPNAPIQQIFYGCPGSGKSRKVKDIVDSINPDYVFRTTFHPDTDYASFVGCYKPITKCAKVLKRVDYSIDDLAAILKKNYEEADIKTVALHSFALEYADYFNGAIAQYSKKDLVIKAGLSEDYKVEINKIVNLFGWMKAKGYINTNDSIVYEFVPQTFTNAYIKAWEDTSKPVYLIIEEINRGNCAQIFGDLFQLLDRDKETGKSEYPIKADKDLVAHIEKVLGAGHEGIKNGELCLPPNLIIYATMNTSDQSLFPMDSAFKRRWDWEYVPINYSKDIDSGKFIIEIDEHTKYNWIEFLESVNDKIYNATNSEDKQMGNFFIKKSIKATEFVNKVMFYLWNEVCKEEYGTQRNFFHKGKEGKTEFKFTELFGDNQATILKDFMTSLGVEPIV